MDKKYDIAVVDGQNIFFKAFSVNGNLSSKINGEEVKLGGVYGFFKSMISLKRDYLTEDSQILVAWDRGHKRRTELYPEYKANRNRDEWEERENFINQINTLKRILTFSGIYQVDKDGEEADDIAGSLSRSRGENGNKVLLFSADKDFQQLICENVDLLAHKGRDNIRVWNENNWEDEFGYHPKYFSYNLALMGDKGDNIPGVTGIGEKTAIKFLCENFNLIDALINDKNYSSFIPEKQSSYMKRLLKEENINLLRLSHKLAKIDRYVKGMKIKKGMKNFDYLEEFFEIAKFNSLLNDKNWKTIKNL